MEFFFINTPCGAICYSLQEGEGGARSVGPGTKSSLGLLEYELKMGEMTQLTPRNTFPPALNLNPEYIKCMRSLITI